MYLEDLLISLDEELNYISDNMYLSDYFKCFINDDYDEDEKKLFMKCCCALDEEDCKVFVLKYVGYMKKLNKSINIDDFILSNLKNNDDEYDFNYLNRCKDVIEKVVDDIANVFVCNIDQYLVYDEMCDYEMDN